MHIRRRFDVESRWAIRTYLRCNSTTRLIGYVDRGLDSVCGVDPDSLRCNQTLLRSGLKPHTRPPVSNRSRQRDTRRSIFFEQWIADNRRRCNLSCLFFTFAKQRNVRILTLDCYCRLMISWVGRSTSPFSLLFICLLRSLQFLSSLFYNLFILMELQNLIYFQFIVRLVW